MLHVRPARYRANPALHTAAIPYEGRATTETRPGFYRPSCTQLSDASPLGHGPLGRTRPTTLKLQALSHAAPNPEKELRPFRLSPRVEAGPLRDAELV